MREILEKRGVASRTVPGTMPTSHGLIPAVDVVLLQKPSQSDLPTCSFPFHPCSTTQDQALITALNFILTQEENRRSLFVPDTLDLSFTSEIWQRQI